MDYPYWEGYRDIQYGPGYRNPYDAGSEEWSGYLNGCEAARKDGW